MSLKHALLGFLNDQSMTGYQLKQIFDRSVRNFWNASLSQIYPTLTQMKEEGLLTMELIYQDSSPNAKVYQITAKGKEELQRWLAEPMEPQQYRNSFLIKIFFGANVDKCFIIDQLKQRLEIAATNLQNYRQIQQDIRTQHAVENDGNRRAVFWEMTADFGVKQEEAAVAWYKESIQKLEQLNNKGAGSR